MNARRIASASLVLLAASAAAFAPGSASAQSANPFTVQEPGFTTTDLGATSGPKGAACSPGGVWGDYIYVSESSGDAIGRIDFSDAMSPFASGAPDIAFPVGITFGPGPLSNFGTYMYVASYSSGRITKVDPSGIPSLFVMFPQVSDVKFDPTGAYSTDLFAISYYGTITTVDPAGTITPFASGVASSYMRFGPGGAWGTGLYATCNAGSLGVGIVTIDAGGSATSFVSGFTVPEQFDWASGGAFMGDMFATDMADGKVWRIKSDGTKTLFATGERPAGVTFCNGCLYITSYAGGCWKVCNAPVSVKGTSWGTLKQMYGTPKAPANAGD